MLSRPGIFRIPNGTSPYLNGIEACYDAGYNHGQPCDDYNWRCTPYNGNCVDSSYCGLSLGGTVAIGVGGAAVTVAVTVT